MTSPLQIYSVYQQRLQDQDYAHLGEVIDLQGYTENCLGPDWLDHRLQRRAPELGKQHLGRVH